MYRLLLLFAILSVLSPVFALQAGDAELGTVNEGIHKILVPLINDGDKQVILDLALTPRSRYLESYITFPKRVVLAPGEQQTAELFLTITNQLWPGTHAVHILPAPRASNGSGVTITSVPVITLTFTIPGTVVKRVTVESITVDRTGSPTRITATVNNSGNTRLSVFPKIDVWHDGVFLETVNYHTEMLVEPGTHDLSVSYTPSNAGSYRASVYLLYDASVSNRRDITFSVADTDFTVQPESGTTQTSPADGLSQNATISIGTVEADSPGIYIRDLALFGDIAGIRARMRVENTFQTHENYTYRFDAFQNSVFSETITRNDSISGTSLKDVEETFSLPFGSYTVIATITHIAGQHNATAIIDYRLNGAPLPTGAIASQPASLVTALVIIIIIIIALIIVYWRKKRNRRTYTFQPLKGRIGYGKAYYHSPL